jgi:hypothetical protein
MFRRFNNIIVTKQAQLFALTSSSSSLLFFTKCKASSSFEGGEKPTTKFTKEVSSKDAASSTGVEEWDLLDDDLDYWGHLFDEMEEGRFDTADFIDDEMLKNMMMNNSGKEYLGGDKSHTTSNNKEGNKK